MLNGGHSPFGVSPALEKKPMSHTKCFSPFSRSNRPLMRDFGDFWLFTWSFFFIFFLSGLMFPLKQNSTEECLEEFREKYSLSSIFTQHTFTYRAAYGVSRGYWQNKRSNDHMVISLLWSMKALNGVIKKIERKLVNYNWSSACLLMWLRHPFLDRVNQKRGTTRVDTFVYLLFFLWPITLIWSVTDY